MPAPAGAGIAADSQQAGKGGPESSSLEDRILVENDRDRRTLAWLLANVGHDKIIDACDGLAGSRKPYLSNIIKILGVTVPDLSVTDRETARQHLAAIRGKLRGRS